MTHISPEHFAERFDLSVSTVRRWVREGRLRSIKLGHLVRIDLQSGAEQFGLGEAASPKPSRDRRRAEQERQAAAALLGGGRG